MAGELQPLDQKFAIVDANGNPTDYFTRWAQKRQIDIGSSITLGDLEEFLTAHMLKEGQGIALTPDGDLNNLPSIAIRNGVGLNFDAMHNIKLADTAVILGTYGDATHVPQITVDQQGRITGVTLVAISGGGGGGRSSVNSLGVLPALATFTQDNVTAARTVVENPGKAFSFLATGVVAAVQVHGVRIAAPLVTPYRVAVFIQNNNDGLRFHGPALGWSNGTAHMLLYDQSQNFEYAPWPNSSTRGGVTTVLNMRALPFGTGVWFGLRDDGTNFIWEMSADGANFVPFFQVARNAAYNQIYVGQFSYNQDINLSSSSMLAYDPTAITGRVAG